MDGSADHNGCYLKHKRDWILYKSDKLKVHCVHQRLNQRAGQLSLHCMWLVTWIKSKKRNIKTDEHEKPAVVLQLDVIVHPFDVIG